MSQTWSVIACQCRKENETAWWLRQFGSIIFIPLRWVEIKNKRNLSHNQRHRSSFQKVLRPLFPGYFFGSNLRAPYGDFREIPGLRGILHGHRVDQAVASMQSSSNLDGVIDIPITKENPIGLGDVIQVISGPFAGFGGTVVEIMPQKLDEDDRITADIALFGRLTPVALYIDNINVVAKGSHPECSARPEIRSAA